MGIGSIYVGLRALSARDLHTAMLSQEACASVVARLAARTEQGTLFAFLGRLATASCDWLDGDLAVELFGENEATRLRVLAELGGGVRERVLPPVVVNAPVEDLAFLAEKAGGVLGPLRMKRVSPRSFLLTPTDEEPPTTSLELS